MSGAAEDKTPTQDKRSKVDTPTKDPEWLSKYPRKPLDSVKAREQQLDAELQDSFPASDPPSHSPGTAGDGKKH